MGTRDEPTVGILLQDLARQYDPVRKPRQDALDRLTSALLKRAQPGYRQKPRVRGDGVAVDTLVRAVITEGRMGRCELFAHPQSVSLWEKHIGELMGSPRSGGGSVVRVNSFRELIAGLDKFRLTAWFDPNASLAASLHIRRNFASRLYPVTAGVHGFSTHVMFNTFFLRSMLLGTYPCDSTICFTRACRDGMEKIFARVAEGFNREHGTRIAYQGRLDVIPLCVDTEQLQPRDKAAARAHVNLEKNSVVLLYLGYLSLWKADLVPLLKVFGSLLDKNPGRRIRLVIAGTEHGSYVATLREYAASLGVKEFVRFVLNPSDETKRWLMASADVFVSPVDNLQESFGLAPVEAMACGVPQVVADWDGYRETVVHGETGFLVPTLWAKCDGDLERTGPLLGWEFDHLCLGQSVCVDAEAMESFLQKLIGNDRLRGQMAEQSRRRALEVYSFSSAMKLYRELWLELARVAEDLETTLAPDEPGLAAYWETFQHYPTRPIPHHAQIRITPDGEHALQRGLKAPLHSDIRKLGILDEALLLEILAMAGAAPQNDGGLTFGGIRERVAARTGQHQDRVGRHILWLVKQGLAKPRLEAHGDDATAALSETIP